MLNMLSTSHLTVLSMCQPVALRRFLVLPFGFSGRMVIENVSFPAFFIVIMPALASSLSVRYLVCRDIPNCFNPPFGMLKVLQYPSATYRFQT